MSVEVIAYFAGAIVAAVAAGFTFRNVGRLKAQKDWKNANDQSGAVLALGILAIVLVILGTHNLG